MNLSIEASPIACALGGVWVWSLARRSLTKSDAGTLPWLILFVPLALLPDFGGPIASIVRQPEVAEVFRIPVGLSHSVGFLLGFALLVSVAVGLTNADAKGFALFASVALGLLVNPVLDLLAGGWVRIGWPLIGDPVHLGRALLHPWPAADAAGAWGAYRLQDIALFVGSIVTALGYQEKVSGEQRSGPGWLLVFGGGALALFALVFGGPTQ